MGRWVRPGTSRGSSALVILFAPGAVDTPHPPSPSQGPESAPSGAPLLTVTSAAAGGRSSVPSRRSAAGPVAGRPRWESTARTGTWRSPAAAAVAAAAPAGAVPRAAAAHQACSGRPRWPGHRHAPGGRARGQRVRVAGDRRPQLGIGACRFVGLAARRRLRRRAGGVAGTGARQDQGRPGAVALDRDGRARSRRRADRARGTGRRSRVDARPGHLAADVYAPGTRLRLSVALAEDDRVAVAYADPRGGTRTVTHAALASVELIMQRPGIAS